MLNLHLARAPSREERGHPPTPAPHHQVMGQQAASRQSADAQRGAAAPKAGRRASLKGPQAHKHTHNGHPHTCLAMTRLPLAVVLGPLRDARQPRDTRPPPRAQLKANNGGSSSPRNTRQPPPLTKPHSS